MLRPTVEQGAVGLQLVAEIREARDDLFHIGAVQRRLAAVEGDVGFVALELRVDEGGELLQRVADVLLRAEYLTYAERAVGTLEVALEGGEQLQLDAVAGNGWLAGAGGLSAGRGAKEGDGLDAGHR